MDAKLRLILAGRFQTLERDAAKAAWILNAASVELRSLSESVTAREQEHARLQTACYQTEARLTEARKATAELNVEVERTRGRLELSGQAERRHRAADRQGETESQALESQVAALEAELDRHRKTVADLEVLTATARQWQHRKE